MPAATKAFAFVCGPDDFLVNRIGQERFAALAAEAGADDMAREIVSGFANNVDEVETAVNRFREVVLTVPMFGGKRVVWFKDVNFLADSVTGRAEGTLRQVEALQELLAKVNADEVSVVITAAPVDRRRSFPKWCEAHSDFTLAGGDGDNAAEALAGVVLGEARACGVTFGEGAVELLLQKVGANTRLLTEEVRKLATYAGDPAVIEEAHVAELTANTAEGDFFEAADRFFAGDLPGTLRALQKHFFAGGDARPIISALQNRNRILLQARVLIDAGDLRAPGPYGFDKAAFARAQAAYAKHFGGDAEKSSFNFFTQNQWYVGKLVSSAKLPSLRRLIDNQQEFIRAFEEIIARSSEQETVLRDLAVRCLTA
ncbi:MAG: DNA polymerase III subunit delta [Opitutae bacterium]|nr:DNA polymerase III subunit delta [Opitutae bacterium]